MVETAQLLQDVWNEILDWFTGSPTVGHQLFVCRGRTAAPVTEATWADFHTANDLFVYRDRAAPLSEDAWARFIAANKDKMPKEVADWESWDLFPDRTMCSRYYGRGHQEYWMSHVEEITKIISKFCIINAPKIPFWDESYANLPPDRYRVVEAISRFMGKPVTDTGIVSPEDNLLTVATDDFAFATFQFATWCVPPFSAEPIVSESTDAEATLPSVVTAITIKQGHECYQLVAEGVPPFVVPAEFRAFFGAFVRKLLCNAREEPVEWYVLHDAMQEKPDNQNVASKSLRRAKLTLNEQLKKWGRPPKGEDWILRKVGSGYYLNTSCDWKIDETLRRELISRQSAWSFTVDSAKMANNTADKANKLPAKPYRPESPHKDDDE